MFRTLRAVVRVTRSQAKPCLLRTANKRGFSDSHYKTFADKEDPTIRAQERRKKFIFGGILTVAGGAYIISHLETVPYTNRRRFNFLSKEYEEKAGADAYEMFQKKFESKSLPENNPIFVKVRAIVDTILSANNIPGDWTLTVVDSTIINCFVIPGRHIYVFTGIDQVTNFKKGEPDALAFIMGHEIAHVLAHHSMEKMSLRYLSELIQFTIAQVFNIPMDLTKTASRLALNLPNSRTLESEADQIGISLMSKACYQPDQAIVAMRNLAKSGNGGIEWLSTHPMGEKRVERLKILLPQARRQFDESGCTNYKQFVEVFDQDKQDEQDE